MRPRAGQREIVADAGGAVRLDGTIEDAQRHPRHHHLDHGNLPARRLVAHGVHQICGLHRQQPRLLDFHPRLRDIGADRALLGQRLAESNAPGDTVAHRLERAFGDADEAHAMMDAPRAETPLRDFEPAALAEQHVRGRHTHILERNLCVPVRRIVITENREHAANRHAGRVHRNQNHRLLLVLLSSWIGFPHEDRDPAARIARARDPPFAPIDRVVVAVANDGGLDVRGVRRGNVGFRHREARANRAREQWFEPLLALCVRAIANQHFHVSRVGRRAVEYLGPETRHVPHDFAQRCVFDIRQAGAVLVIEAHGAHDTFSGWNVT